MEYQKEEICEASTSPVPESLFLRAKSNMDREERDTNKTNYQIRLEL